MLLTPYSAFRCVAGPSRLVPHRALSSLGSPRGVNGYSARLRHHRAAGHPPSFFSRKSSTSSRSLSLPLTLPRRPSRTPACSFSSTSHRPFPPLTHQPPPSRPFRQPAPPPESDPIPALKLDTPIAVANENSQAKTDWRIILKLAENIWPRGSPRTKIRVIGALGLLVGGKILNVQVPFYFKDIVDALNVPITSGSTVWVLAGASIAGCWYLRY